VTEWPYLDRCEKTETDPTHKCDKSCLPADYLERWKAIKRYTYSQLPVEYVEKEDWLPVGFFKGEELE